MAANTPETPAAAAAPAILLSAGIPLDSLPAAKREMSPEKRALAESILSVIADGKTGTTYVDADGNALTYPDNGAAGKVATGVKRLVARVNTDASRVVATRTVENADGTFGWVVYTRTAKGAK